MTKGRIILTLVLVLGFAVNLIADYEVGQEYHGFKLIEKRFVKEVNSDCYVFDHVKSGARLVKIAADDNNKTFGITFKTVPEADWGTPHIMEHSVLNGSKNFPVKSPFDVLIKGSLNTFLNAMTSSDWTMYPVASMNDKDYFNLMHVYLDAVLNPLIYDDPRIFKQEGWHHELVHKDSAIVYKGVVYNEMKGAFSSPTTELNYQVYKNIFPDNSYGNESGGYPTAIPKLTYEKFLDFHRRFYHPVNSYIFLYGDADLDKELNFIDSEYLSKYDKEDVRAKIGIQKPFDEMKEVTAYYPVIEGQSIEDQTYLAFTSVAGLNTDRALAMALDILSDVLVNQESAPVRLALQQAGIGKDVSAYVDDIKQNVFSIIVNNANPVDGQKFHEIVMNTLDEIVKNGLDKKAVEGTINRLEFRLREGDSAQKGLRYLFQLIPGWLFTDDPFHSLEYEKPLAQVKTALNSTYLEDIIKNYLIDNNHQLLLTLAPKPGLEQENNELIRKELEDYKASLDEETLEKLIKETQELIDYQNREDSPEALATIPLLQKSDINPKAEWYDLTETTVAGVKVLHHEEFTDNVVYVDLYFDERVLPMDLIPYSALLSEVLASLNTENYGYGDLDKELNIHTGGFSTGLRTYLENEDDEALIAKFVLSSKATNQKVDKLFELAREIVTKTKYGDKDRLKAVLTRHQARLDAAVKGNGFGYTRSRINSYFSNNGMFDELTSGLAYYWFITDLTNSYDARADEIIDNLVKTAELLFNQRNLIAATTCKAEDLALINAQLTDFVKSLPRSLTVAEVWKLEPAKRNEGLLSASKVQYVLQGYDFKKLGYEWDGKYRVLSKILSSDYLQNKIRVIGGAYGGFSIISSNGNFVLASYRDPNLKETLENYDGVVDYLSTFEADDESMTRYIIGTIAGMDRPLRPSEKGSVAVRRYFQKTTPERVQSDRDAVLATTASDIRNMTKLVQDVLAQEAVCVYGNEEKIKDNKVLFNEIVPITK
ncbi:insulinase family protein [candidate division KSB1 bacterium]|nr:insulinase family protein [candidate division KSB1 bacterium]